MVVKGTSSGGGACAVDVAEVPVEDVFVNGVFVLEDTRDNAVGDFDGCPCAVGDEGEGKCGASRSDGVRGCARFVGADSVGPCVAATVVGLPGCNVVLAPVGDHEVGEGWGCQSGQRCGDCCKMHDNGFVEITISC